VIVRVPLPSSFTLCSIVEIQLFGESMSMDRLDVVHVNCEAVAEDVLDPVLMIFRAESWHTSIKLYVGHNLTCTTSPPSIHELSRQSTVVHRRQQRNGFLIYMVKRQTRKADSGVCNASRGI
jgi:hypothetical protein